MIWKRHYSSVIWMMMRAMRIENNRPKITKTENQNDSKWENRIHISMKKIWINLNQIEHILSVDCGLSNLYRVKEMNVVVAVNWKISFYAHSTKLLVASRCYENLLQINFKNNEQNSSFMRASYVLSIARNILLYFLTLNSCYFLV